MNDAGRVRRLERAADLDAEPPHVLEWQRAARDAFGQRRSIEILEYEIGGIADAHIVQHADVWMRDAREGARFVLEPPRKHGVGGERAVQDFDRDGPPEARVAGAIDLAHAAFAERRLNLVGSQAASRDERHPRGIICGTAVRSGAARYFSALL